MTVSIGSFMPYGQLFVISAPSGAGKTSLIAAALDVIANLVVSTSHTTRSPRLGEKDGSDYHFVSDFEFQELIKSKALFEHAKVMEPDWDDLVVWNRHQIHPYGHLSLSRELHRAMQFEAWRDELIHLIY